MAASPLNFPEALIQLAARAPISLKHLLEGCGSPWILAFRTQGDFFEGDSSPWNHNGGIGITQDILQYHD